VAPHQIPETVDTLQLLERVRGGDEEALEVLVQRYVPRLKRWARGRLPIEARGAVDTDDMVQETMVRVLRKVKDFKPEREGSFAVYLRRAILNRITDETRRLQHHVHSVHNLVEQVPSKLSPLDHVLGEEATQRYEAALTRIKEEDRELIVMRLELQCGYREIADALGRASPDAARMAVGRAALRLAEEMRRAG